MTPAVLFFFYVNVDNGYNLATVSDNDPGIDELQVL